MTALLSLNKIEKYLYVQVRIIDLVYHLSYHNKEEIEIQGQATSSQSAMW